jgi:ribonuclease HI
MLAFPAPGKPLPDDARARAVAAVAVFNGVVWFERSYYFKTLEAPPSLEESTNWLADVAAMDHISSYGPKATSGLGKAGNRTASQKTAARTYGRLLLEKIKPDSLIAFTDGASKGNPGPCGSGAYLYDKSDAKGWDVEASAALGHGTNNAGELWAIGVALELATSRLLTHPHLYKQFYILTDSQYCRGVLTMGWRSLTHPGLAKKLKLLIRDFPIPVIVDWVPAHVGIDSNERADELADQGARQSGKHGPNVDVAVDYERGHFIPRHYDG